MELTKIMGILKNPNFSVKEFINAPRSVDHMTDEQREKHDEEQRVMDDKLKKSEESLNFTSHNFDDFNSHTERMLAHTPQKIISEMSIRLFVGSRDIPKNIPKAMKLLQFAKDKPESELSEKDQGDIRFYEIMLNKLTRQDANDPNKFWEANEKLLELAKEGHPNAMYVYGSELFQLCTNNVLQDKKLVRGYLSTAYEYMNEAANLRIAPAYYYLGMCHEHGYGVRKDTIQAKNFYINGAARNDALCLYNLSRIFKEATENNNNKYLHFKYLKRAAEEGHVIAQHLLGVAYFEGKYTNKNEKLSLAWFREAAKNGEPLS